MGTRWSEPPDTPIAAATLEPVAMEKEIEFVSEPRRNSGEEADPRRCSQRLCRIRPLVKSSAVGNTAALSRDHSIHIEKVRPDNHRRRQWTTYRRMAEDCVNQARCWPSCPTKACITAISISTVFTATRDAFGPSLCVWIRRPAIEALIAADPQPRRPLPPRAPLYRGGGGFWAVRFEMARTVEDVLARRIVRFFPRRPSGAGDGLRAVTHGV